MMTPKLKTIEMTRQIRDQQYEQLKDKTHAERIAFYQKQARQLHSRLQAAIQELHEAERKLV